MIQNKSVCGRSPLSVKMGLGAHRLGITDTVQVGIGNTYVVRKSSTMVARKGP